VGAAALATPADAAATPAFVQQVNSTPGSAPVTQVQVSYSAGQTSAQVAGDTNVVAVGFGDPTSVISSVTDNKGNSYAVAAPLTHDGFDSQAVYYAKNIATGAGNTVVTVTFASAVPYPDVRVVEYGGLDRSAPLDVTTSATAAGSAASSGSVTTAYANDLVFGAGLTSSTFTAATSGYTDRVITTDGNIAEDLATTSAGSYSATATLTSGNWIMQLAAFKAASATAVTVTGVSATNADGEYRAGSIIAVQVTFSAPVVVAGTPQLALATGAAPTLVNYTMGSGTATLTFDYTAAAGDAATRLDYASTQALSARGASISDQTGTAAVLTLAAPGAAGSLGAARNITIDTDSPVLAERTPVTPVTTTATPTYVFTSSDSGVLHFGGGCSSPTTIAMVGVNTITFNALANGTYAGCTIEVTDPPGNTSAPLMVSTFTVDGPVPALSQVTPVNPALTNSRTPTYGFASSEAGTIRYGGGCSSTTTTVVAGTNTITFAALADGTYAHCTITVVDDLGNASLALAVASFTVDTTPPTTPAAPVSQSAATVAMPIWTWTAASDVNGLANPPYTVQWSQDGTFATDVSTATSTSTSYPNTTPLANGTWYFRVQATDAAGNVGSYSPAGRDTINAAGPVYPLRTSADGRYLVDQNNTPFLMRCEASQGMIVRLPLTGPGSSEEYFTHRHAQGFNTVWINLLARTDNGGSPNGSTFDGISPFQAGAQDDLSQLNPVYFQRAHDMISQAATHNFLVLLDPIETINHLGVLRTNGATKDQAYGAFLGSYFKDLPNIVWLNGNDYSYNASDDVLTLAVLHGIQSTDRPDRLQTVELYPTPVGSLDDPAWVPYINVDGVYTYAPSYAETLHEYNLAATSGTIPTILMETFYDQANIAPINQTLQPDHVFRNQEYWSALSGAVGQVYGNYETVRFPDGWDQPANIDTSVVSEFGYLNGLLGNLAWYSLQPDQNNSFLTGGIGTYVGYEIYNSDGSAHQSDYAVAAVAADQSAGLVYLPTPRTITVDLAKLNGPVTARWFDPTTNTYTAIGTFPNNGSQQFTPPNATHADGSGDWVLVLTTGQFTPDTTPPVISNVAATAIAGTSATISWTTDKFSDSQIDYGTTTAYGSQTTLSTTYVTSHVQSLTGLRPSTVYHYRIRSRDIANNLGVSADATFTTAPPAPSPHLVAATSATDDASATTISATFTGANTPGDLIAVAVSWGGDGGAPGCADSLGNSYAVATAQYDSLMDQSLAICYAANIRPGSGDTVTVTFSGGQPYRRLIATEYAGVAAAAPVDALAQNIGTSATVTNDVTSGTATTYTNGDLIFGAVMDDTATTAITAGTGFTQRDSLNNEDLAVQDMVQPGAGAVTSTQTFASGHDYLAQLVAFKP
jgi:hypothetical protein